VIALIGVERQKAHQVQGVCVIGIRRKRLPAAELGIEVSSGMQMRETGLVERGRIAYTRLVQDLGAAGGRTFAN